MKTAISVLFLFVATVTFGSHVKKGNVHLVENVPVYLFSTPVQKYSETGTIGSSFTGLLWLSPDDCQELTINQRVGLIVRNAKRKLRKGKIENFDAILINRDGTIGTLIKFDGEASTESHVEMVENKPVYIFCTPASNYKEVGMINNVFRTSFSSYSVSSFVRRAKRKNEKGKLADFDAIVISSDGVRAYLIKFDQ
ncbi:MAG: hypothetical protein AB8B72_06930 [Crocinitomicaceae bacterium]